MISIIIPLYNQAKLVGRCLESILAQTYQPQEVVVVNDGSEDNPQVVLNKFKPRFKEAGIRFEIMNQVNKGAAAARNQGAKNAGGKYLLFVDADIVLKPEMLAKMKAVLDKHPQISYVYSAHKFGFKKFKCLAFSASRLKQMPYIHTTSLLRREHFPGFDESLKRLQDWDLWLTMLEQGRRGMGIDEVLFTVKPGGTMSSWLPSFAYRFLPFLPQVKKYKQAIEIIKKKHKI